MNKIKIIIIIPILLVQIIAITIITKKIINKIDKNFNQEFNQLEKYFENQQEILNQTPGKFKEINEKIDQYREEISLYRSRVNTPLIYYEKLKKAAHIACQHYKLGKQCEKDLLAIAWVESRFNCLAVGDYGKSFGCFQIHSGFHPHITYKQAQDVNFSTFWTLDRLIKYNYKKNRSYAIQCHNGCMANNGYAKMVMVKSKRKI